MSTLNIGFISAGGIFAKKLVRADREKALLDFEMIAEDGERCLKDDVAERFASLCDFALKRTIREAQCQVKTLRVEVGYGYAEHHKGWMRLGCELMVEEEEADEAFTFLEDPENAGGLEVRLGGSTREFINHHFGMAVFPEVSCSFYLLDNPRQA